MCLAALRNEGAVTLIQFDLYFARAAFAAPGYREPSRWPRLGHAASIPRAERCVPRRRHSVPGPVAFRAGATLTLLRVPF